MRNFYKNRYKCIKMSTYLAVVAELAFEPSSLTAGDVLELLAVTFEEILIVHACQESKIIIKF